MALPDAQTVADKWSQRSSAAAQDYAQGVASTTKDPTALAAANGARYIQGIQDAYNSGKWARRLQQVGKAGWQQAVAAKGVANYGTGVMAGRDKFAQAMGPVLQAIGQAQAQVASMPSVTAAQRDARMLAYVQYMRQWGANR